MGCKYQWAYILLMGLQTYEFQAANINGPQIYELWGAHISGLTYY